MTNTAERKEFTLTPERAVQLLRELTLAPKSTGTQRHQAWYALGAEMGFVPDSVRLVSYVGGGVLVFTALVIPSRPDWIESFTTKWSGAEMVEAGEVLDWLLHNVPFSPPANVNGDALTDAQILQFAQHAADRISPDNYGGRVIHAVRMAEAARSPDIPDKVRQMAIRLQTGGYSGPLVWARTVIDWVAER